MAVEQIAIGRWELSRARQRIFVFAGHGDGLEERHSERGAEGVVLTAVELQEIGLHVLDNRADIDGSVVHHQRHHRNFLGHQRTQDACLLNREPAFAVRRENQPHVIHAQLHGKAHVLGASESTEFDAGVGHGAAAVSGRSSVIVMAGCLGEGWGSWFLVLGCWLLVSLSASAHIVIPANAGIHLDLDLDLDLDPDPRIQKATATSRWIPAFAGMTMLEVQEAGSMNQQSTTKNQQPLLPQKTDLLRQPPHRRIQRPQEHQSIRRSRRPRHSTIAASQKFRDPRFRLFAATYQQQ